MWMWNGTKWVQIGTVTSTVKNLLRNTAFWSYNYKYFDIHSNNKDINRLKKKLKEQCNKIKKYKEKIDKKIIKETNKDKKEYLEFINDFWALYLNKI